MLHYIFKFKYNIEVKIILLYTKKTVIFQNQTLTVKCPVQMWRTQKAYKMRLEKETDENIMRSKEKATKLQEPSVSFIQVNMYTFLFKFLINVYKFVYFTIQQCNYKKFLKRM